MSLKDFLPKGVEGIENWSGLKVRVEQEELTANLRYLAFAGDLPGFRAAANRALLPVRRELTLTDVSGEAVATLKQTSVVRRWIEYVRIPIYCPYEVRIGEDQLGWVVQRFLPGQLRASALFRGERYRIRSHCWNLYSVWRAGRQTGLIQRQAERTWSADNYIGQFDRDFEPVFAVLLVLFCDLAWHTNQALDSWGFSYVASWTAPPRGQGLASQRIVSFRASSS